MAKENQMLHEEFDQTRKHHSEIKRKSESQNDIIEKLQKIFATKYQYSEILWRRSKLPVDSRNLDILRNEEDKNTQTDATTDYVDVTTQTHDLGHSLLGGRDLHNE
ncbi:hypothetical protein HHI36_016991 [Cryptolaemus montrouzieri]|uniref:Uncharacterized protein n=1 Tax=Cryptolaemus montrouzieri TaxID=559131 RepID=A0ABD2NL68_9CUCU